MGECGDNLRRPLVVLLGLIGKSIEKIPVGHDFELRAPLEKADILKRRRALSHQLEHGRAETLDARLHGADSGVAHLFQLALLQIHLGFIVEVVVDVESAEPRHQLTHMLHVDDVVDHDEAELPVSFRERPHLLDDTLGALAAKSHGRTVQSTESAVMLGAPPAAARALVGDARDTHLAEDRAALHAREVLVVVGKRGRM